MQSLAISLLLLIKDAVLVARHHLRLGRHLGAPSLQAPDHHAAPPQRSTDGGDDGVDEAETLALAALLWHGETPGAFPEQVLLVWIRLREGIWRDGNGGGNQRRPPERGFVGRKAPNMLSAA